MPVRHKTPDTKRSGVVKVSLTISEKAALEKAATAAGIPLSIYARAAALEKAAAAGFKVNPEEERLS